MGSRSRRSILRAGSGCDVWIVSPPRAERGCAGRWLPEKSHHHHNHNHNHHNHNGAAAPAAERKAAEPKGLAQEDSASRTA